MRRGVVLLALLAVACTRTSPTTVKPKASPTRAVTAASSAPSTAPSPTAAPGGLDASRHSILLDALANAAAASRAAKVSGTLGDISGVLSNNSASIIANNAGNIISDNGGSLISDHGGALTGKTKRQLLSFASPTPGPQDEVFMAQHFTSETSTLVYKIDADEPTKGGFKSYDRTGYHNLPPEKLAEALVDDFIWDDVKNIHPWNNDEATVAEEYYLKRISSKRVPFGERFISRQLVRIGPNATGDGVTTKIVGFEIEFGLDVALLGGQLDHSSFKAVAAEQDLTEVPDSNGGTFSLPNNLALTGSNDRGSYTGRIVSKDGAVDVQVTHATAAGAKTALTIKTAQDGTTREVVGIPAAHLVLTADIDAKNGGTGILEDDQGAKPLKLGDVSWDADGLATIKLADGTSFQARLF